MTNTTTRAEREKFFAALRDPTKRREIISILAPVQKIVVIPPAGKKTRS